MFDRKPDEIARERAPEVRALARAAQSISAKAQIERPPLPADALS
jgi:hypothetical protein